MGETDGDARAEGTDVLGRVLSVLGLIAHLVVGLFFFLPAGLVAPLYGIAILDVVWLIFLWQAIRWWNRKPRMVILIPVVALIWWFAVISFGERFLGWTA